MKLFFDTETTGLPKNYNAPASDVDNWPRLVQIGWILSDDDGNEKESFEALIKPNGFEIPEAASNIHGVTTQRALEQGYDLKIILAQLSRFCEMADTLVGHNIKFDMNVLLAEYIRSGMDNPFLNKKTVDTMSSSKEFCKLPGKYGYKYPKLAELYKVLFESDMGHAHTALADIQNTAKCYYELVASKIIA